MLTVAEAQKKILTDKLLERFIARDHQSISLLHARQRILASDQVAEVNVPPWDNSAMDGYALRTSDTLTHHMLPVSQVIAAGTFPQALHANTVARIFTGAPVPPGADAVEMQENTRIHQAEDPNETQIEFLQDIKPGANIRRCGEDIAKGSTVITAGTVLHAAHIGLLASIGRTDVPVHPVLRVGICSTGDELAEPGTTLHPGQIYNSNRYLLQSLLQQLGCTVIDGGCIADDLNSTQQQLQALAQQVDVLISTGGVSVGDEDHVKHAIETIGSLNLWKIAVKPGKPLAFGCIRRSDDPVGHTAFFGLPGNPVSALVTFLLFVKPYLLKAMGAHDCLPAFIQTTADFDWPPSKQSGQAPQPLGREEYLRARLREDGRTVELFPNQGSGALSSVAWANGLAVAPQGSVIKRGDVVRFLMF